ncbi:sensor histidine kinase [Foetidibacter luteolus]|uniref:sensor histidine kinase n=1 Tax=Foetidibacter luteolus TaxID=2608880 RepID=UPI00129AB237|nr:ATP-binding protein [Foetidibacter luteolus]
MEDQNPDIIYLVVVGIGAMLILLIGFLLSFNLSQRRKFRYRQEMMQLREQQQNQLIEAAIRGEEAERKRVAEELHDDVGAVLSATKLFMFNINTEPLDDAGRVSHEKCIDLLTESISKVRTISHNLHGGMLHDLGLNEAIRSFIKKISQGSTLATNVELEESYDSLGNDADIHVYRVIQELCNNILKHSKPTYINLSSWLESTRVHFQLQYNGRGLSQQQFEALRYSANGLGLKNIHNRILLTGGEIRFTADPEVNTTEIRVPVKNVE